jgi:hypothetical protein
MADAVPPPLLLPRWGREQQQQPRHAFKLLARTAAAAQELLRVGVGVALSVHHLQLAVGHQKAAGEVWLRDVQTGINRL